MALCDIAFMGGGVRGIALAGAIIELEKKGYTFRNVAGVSAGAIAACLVAAGFSGLEIENELSNLDYNKFKSKDYRALTILGDYINLRRDFGVYSADYFENWLYSVLRKKSVYTFSDIKINSLKVTVADIENKRLLVFPDDLYLFGIDYKNFSLAKAVRASMSIPLFYEPFRLKDKSGTEHILVDGGIFCNYPIWLLDDGCKKPEVPIFGAVFEEGDFDNPKRKSNNKNPYKLVDYIKKIIGAALDASGHGYARIVKGNDYRTIKISVAVDNKNINSTDFDISKKDSAALFENGKTATKNLLGSFDFDKWAKLRSE